MQGSLVTDIGVVLGVAAVTSVVARVARQPTIVGYLLAGLVVGPYLPIPLAADVHRVEALAEFGVVLVMFAVGLEFRLGRFLRALPVTGLTGLVQVGTLIYVGFSFGSLLGWPTTASLFLGTAIAISSTMVVSRVFVDLPQPQDIREHVLSVLILQDVVAIVLIAAMTAVAEGADMAPDQLGLLLLRLTGVLVGMIIGGLLVIPPVMRVLSRFQSAEILSVFAVGMCFAFAVLAEQLGFSVALGAFIAGIVVAESGRAHEVEHSIAPLRDVFAAIFFVSIGMTVDPVAAWSTLPLSLALAALVIIAQLVSVGVTGVISGIGMRRAFTSGIALGQIGEFGFILAAIGTAGGVVVPDLQPILVTVAVITAFTTPLLLKRAAGIVGAIDHVTPARIQRLLGLYEAWLDRTRREPSEARSPIRRAFVLLVVDAVAIVLVLGLSIAWLPEITTLLTSHLGLSTTVAQALVAGAVLVVCLPFLAGLIRAALAISHRVSNAIIASAADEDAAAVARIAVHSLRAMIYLGIVIGLGFPTIAVLRPLMAGSYGVPILAGLVLVLSIVLWRRAGRADAVYVSGARELADRLVARVREDSGAGHDEDADGGQLPDEAPHSPIVPGLDGVVEIVIPETARAADKTLRELGLRSRTGATVVAIKRGGEGIVLPTGSEHLRAGDTCVIAGSAESTSRAAEELTAVDSA